jgi:hypothetical protein
MALPDDIGRILKQLPHQSIEPMAAASLHLAVAIDRQLRSFVTCPISNPCNLKFGACGRHVMRRN